MDTVFCDPLAIRLSEYHFMRRSSPIDQLPPTLRLMIGLSVRPS
jgi:hypothetical protein